MVIWNVASALILICACVELSNVFLQPKAAPSSDKHVEKILDRRNILSKHH